MHVCVSFHLKNCIIHSFHHHHHHHHHQATLLARISLTFSLPVRPYHLLLPAGPLICILCPHRAVVGKFLLTNQHWLLHVLESIGERHFVLAFPAMFCMSCWSWMVLEMGGKWLYSCYFLLCCFPDLFTITRGILV